MSKNLVANLVDCPALGAPSRETQTNPFDPARAAAGAVIAVLRGGQVLAPDDPRAARLEKGDQLIMVSTRVRPASPS